MLLGRLDVRHQELPGAVGGLHVDGQAQVDVLGPGDGGLAAFLGVGVVHLRHRLERLDHRVPDQVGERDLAAAAALEVVVDHDPVVDQELGRDRTHAGGRGHGQAGRHVGDGARRGAAQPADLGARHRRRRGGPRNRSRSRSRSRNRSGLRRGRDRRGRDGRDRCGLRGRDRCGLRGRCGLRPRRSGGRGGPGRAAGAAVLATVMTGWGPVPLASAGCVVGEETPPGPVHRTRIGQVPLVELFHQPFVGAEVGLAAVLTRTGVTPRARGPPRYPAMTQKTRRTSSPKTLFRRCESLLACPDQATRASPGPGRKITRRLVAMLTCGAGSGVRKCRSRRGAGRYHRRGMAYGPSPPICQARDARQR